MEKEKLERFEKFIQRLPEPEIKRVILVIEGKTFNWKEVLEELKKGGELSKKIEEKITERIK